MLNQQPDLLREIAELRTTVSNLNSQARTTQVAYSNQLARLRNEISGLQSRNDALSRALTDSEGRVTLFETAAQHERMRARTNEAMNLLAAISIVGESIPTSQAMLLEQSRHAETIRRSQLNVDALRSTAPYHAWNESYHADLLRVWELTPTNGLAQSETSLGESIRTLQKRLRTAVDTAIQDLCVQGAKGKSKPSRDRSEAPNVIMGLSVLLDEHARLLELAKEYSSLLPESTTSAQQPPPRADTNQPRVESLHALASILTGNRFIGRRTFPAAGADVTVRITVEDFREVDGEIIFRQTIVTGANAEPWTGANWTIVYDCVAPVDELLKATLSVEPAENETARLFVRASEGRKVFSITESHSASGEFLRHVKTDVAASSKESFFGFTFQDREKAEAVAQCWRNFVSDRGASRADSPQQNTQNRQSGLGPRSVEQHPSASRVSVPTSKLVLSLGKIWPSVILYNRDGTPYGFVVDVGWDWVDVAIGNGARVTSSTASLPVKRLDRSYVTRNLYVEK